MNGLENGGSNREGVVHKIPFENRAETDEQKQALDYLRKRARFVENLIFTSFGSIPSRKRIGDAMDQVREYLIEIAHEAQDFGRHYDNFKVGGAFLGLRRTEHPWENPWVIMFNANTKQRPENSKWCAEQYLMDEIENPKNRISQVLGFVIVGKTRADDVSHIHGITLTPCKICRDRMLSLAKKPHSAIRLETEVFTANSGSGDDGGRLGLRKIQRVKDLHAFHGERQIEIE